MPFKNIPEKAKSIAVFIVLLSLGWNAHRTFVYAADIYEQAEFCKTTGCSEAVTNQWQVAAAARELQEKKASK